MSYIVPTTPTRTGNVSPSSRSAFSETLKTPAELNTLCKIGRELNSTEAIYQRITRRLIRKRGQWHECEAPRTTFEKTVSEIWADVLKIEKIGINDDFFDLHGNSLL